MAIDAYLKLEGVKGETKTDGMSDYTDVMSFSWGASNPASLMAGGLATGKASYSDLSIMKAMDSCTPQLLEYLTLGTHIPSGDLVLRKTSGNEAIKYLTVVFKDIVISSLQHSGSSGGDVMESLSLAFGEHKFSYVPQKEDGSDDVAVEFGWNLKEQKKTT